MKKEIILKYILSAFMTGAILLSACTKSQMTSTKPAGAGMAGATNTAGGSGPTNGGIDSGGADTVKSKESAVLAILEKEDVLKKQVGEILKNSFYKNKIFKDNDSDIIQIQFKIEEYLEKLNPEKTNQDIMVFINDIKVKVQRPACRDQDDNEKAGSVSEFTPNGTVCFSLTELSKNPPDDLRKQIHALFIHEISHLLGIRKESVRIQNEVLENYDVLFTDRNPNYTILQSILFNANKIKNDALIMIPIVFKKTPTREDKATALRLYRSLRDMMGITSSQATSVVDTLSSPDVLPIPTLNLNLISILNELMKMLTVFDIDLQMSLMHVGNMNQSCTLLRHFNQTQYVLSNLEDYVKLDHRPENLNLEDPDLGLKNCKNYSSP